MHGYLSAAGLLNVHLPAVASNQAAPESSGTSRRRVSGLPVQHLDYQEYVTGSLGIYVPEAYGVPVITVELEDSVLFPGLRDALLTAGTLAEDG